MTTKTYTAITERDGQWWAVQIEGLKGAFTQSRRLDKVDVMAKDLIALLTDRDPDSFDVEVVVKLDSVGEEVMERIAEAREYLEAAQKRMAAAMTKAATTLVRVEGFSLRDAGKVMGVTHQRVDQLVKSGHG